MHRSTTLFLLAGLFAATLAGCGRGQRPIPAGAQLVHIEITASEIRLDPPTARAGDVYVVLATPGSSVEFVQRKATAEAEPGPLSDEDLARLAQNRDTFGIAIEGFSDNGCSGQQRAEDRGRLGYCGNVFMVTVTAGSYAFLAGGAPDAAPRSMAILEVAP